MEILNILNTDVFAHYKLSNEADSLNLIIV